MFRNSTILKFVSIYADCNFLHQYVDERFDPELGPNSDPDPQKKILNLEYCGAGTIYSPLV
jgi:hypothetical protein